jgi:hypothetical protein
MAATHAGYRVTFQDEDTCVGRGGRSAPVRVARLSVFVPQPAFRRALESNPGFAMALEQGPSSDRES